MSQGRVRECLVNLLTTCGQRVGLPKSPSVIFSQTSDLIERQSSMASSTEEMSGGNNDMSGGSRRDEAATEFGVFKDFDFLEYESESIEGESTDNFNWGVRRRPLSQGEEEHSSLKQLEDSLSEKTPVLTVRKRLMTEESSDDEIGSESPLDELVIAPEFDNNPGEAGTSFPPSSLAIRELPSQNISSARSDTSGSSAGDLGEVTPCNASPNYSGIITLRPSKSDVLENWSAFIQANIQIPNNTLRFFHQLHNLIKDVCQSTIKITQESCSFMMHSSVSNITTIKVISSRLHSMIDIISYRILSPNLIWFKESALNNSKFIESMKYGMLEVQEHLETFCDKKDQTALYCNAVKSTLSIEYLNRQQFTEKHHYLLDLGKSLYKLYFQLLLLVEAGNKIITALYHTLIAAELRDITPDINLIKDALVGCSDDNDADGGVPSPIASSPSEINLYKLIESEQYATALAVYKQNKEELLQDIENYIDPGNDVYMILNLYCKKIIQEKEDCFIISNHETDYADIFGRLFQVSAAVADLENLVKTSIAAEVEKMTDSKI